MVSATIAIADAARAGAPFDQLAADLRREVIEVDVAPLDVLLTRRQPAGRVIVTRFAADVDEPTCERVVAWADRRQPRLGLIAWAPSGEPGCAETALAAGFDDAIIGPVSTREVAARIRTVHRRVNGQVAATPARLRFGPIVLDVDGHELWIADKSLPLTTTEMHVMRAMIRAAGRTVTRTELLDVAWGSANFEVSERAVDNVILRLRRKLPDGVIQTVRGVGFRLSADR